MNDSSARESEPPALDPDGGATEAALPVVIHHLSGSELACCCGLALLAREASGGRPCRVEVTVGRQDASGGGNGPDRAPRAGSDRRWHRLPVRGPGSREPEAWLAVELRGDEGVPPSLDRLSSLAAVAGLVLERHRLAREVRRAREDAEEVRTVLGHALRGHLHAALLRADNLLLVLREDGSPDLGGVREQLEVLKGTVEGMVEEIREVVEEPDVRSGAIPRPPDAARELVSVSDLLREAGRSEGAGPGPVRVEVEDEAPAVPADPGRLGTALGELVDLARRSRDASALTVGPDAASSGVRVGLSVELPPHPGPEEPEPGGDASSRGSERGEPVGGAGPRRRASLGEVVAQLGGSLRVEAGPGTRATVEVVLPADSGS